MDHLTEHSQRAQTQSRAARESVNLGERLALSVSELAAALGKSPTYVYRAIWASKIRPLSNAGRLLISKEQINAFLARTEEYNPKKRKAEKAAGEEVANVAS